MTRRRKRSPLLRFALALWAVAIVGGLALTLWHVAGWALATAAVGAAGYALGHRGRTSAGQLQVTAARPSAAVLRPSERRARANGWTPPGRSVLLSTECAGEEHVFCHDLRCGCSCDHPSRDPAPARRAPLPDRPPF